MNKLFIAAVCMTASITSHGQRLFELTSNHAFEKPNISVENLDGKIITVFTDFFTHGPGYYTPAVKINTAQGVSQISFYVDLGQDATVMDFALNKDHQTIILTGFLDDVPGSIFVTEVDLGGNIQQSAVHITQYATAIPHQILYSSQNGQVVIAGTGFTSTLTPSTDLTDKEGFVLGLSSSALNSVAFNTISNTPSSYNDYDMLETITEVNGDYFVAGSANNLNVSNQNIPGTLQHMLVLKIDASGNELFSIIRYNSNSRFTAASVIYSSYNDQVYLLMNNSQEHKFNIVALDPATGLALTPYYSHSIGSSSLSNQLNINGFRIMESANHSIIVAGYLEDRYHTMPAFLIPFQMVLSQNLDYTYQTQIYSSNNNQMQLDYFRLYGDAVLINTPDIMTYDETTDNTYIVNPNTTDQGFDLLTAHIKYGGSCIDYETTVDSTSLPIILSHSDITRGSLPVSQYWRASTISRIINEKDLCTVHKSARSSAITTENEILLYPNPAYDILHISSDESVVSFQIVDMNGSVVYSQTTTESNSEISEIHIGNLQSGVYMITQFMADGLSKHARFVKE